MPARLDALVRALRRTTAVAVVGLLAAPGAGESLLVGAAASLREPVEATARAFEARHPGLRVRLAYGASSTLAAQVRAGAPLDVLLAADVRIASELAREGLAEPPRVFAHNRLVVLLAPGLAALGGPGDLAGPAIRRIAVPEHAVPVGRYAREWLAGHGLLEVLTPRIASTEHARATLVAVDQGAVDAAIVYASDARRARRARVAWEIPDAEQPEIAYAAVALRGSRHPRAAHQFVEFLGGETGRTAFAEAGFAAVHAP